MKKCKSCQTEIDAKATKCPHCQADQRGWFRRHPILTGVLGLVLFFIVVGAIGSSGSKNTTPASNTAPNANNTNSQSTATSVTKAPEVPAEYTSALNKATVYATTMSMSKKGVYDQLVSPAGEKFSANAAQYAIDNVKADWNANALAKAKTYQSTMSMSPSAIHDQLTSDAGEKFTQAEADYAIQHLNDK
jgi:hypothetical protein